MNSRFDQREIDAVTDVIKSGKLSQFFKDHCGGEQVQAFEREFAEYLGVDHAISVSSGTVSLEIALNALGAKHGEVITTPLSFIATGTAILRVGARPVFVDIKKYTLNIDPQKIKKAVTPKTKAIIPVSLLGYPADVPTIKDLVPNIPILEDAAQALGASIDGKKIGSIGEMGSFSFQETKSLTTLGEGGMIVTDNEELAEKCRNIRNHGNVYGPKPMNVACTNARMTEAQAAFGRVQLRKIDDFNKIQRSNAEYFLDNLPSLLEPVYPRSSRNIEPTYLLIPAYAPDSIIREKIINWLTAEAFSQGVQGQNVGCYKSLIYDSPIFGESKGRRTCKNARRAIKQLILFDIHRWHHTKRDIATCLNSLSEFIEDSMTS